MNGGAIAGFFFAMKMALQFDVHIIVAENPIRLSTWRAGFFDAALLQCRSERAFGAAGQADEATCVLFEFFF